MMLSLVGLTAAVAAAPAPPSNAAFVETPSGRLQGFVNKSRNLRAFRGIPYAKPPVGDLRWRSPVKYGKWTGTRNATQFGNTCMQSSRGGWATVEGVKTASEDCLYLNVVAPVTSSNAERLFPVVVYLHAGEFDYGAASDRESDWPFADDVVYVSPNSRLGALGYLGSEELRSRTSEGATGSYGLADQRLALQWVRDNIAAFGGNASNVMIMGESSGGTSVAAHLVMPSSWGLFHKAVLESPGLTQTKPLADAQLNAKYVRDALLARKSAGCRRAPSAAYDKFEDAVLAGRDHLGGGVNWNYSRAVDACEALPACVGFSMVHTPKRGWLPALTTVKLHASPEIFGGGYLHLPPNSSATSYMKAAVHGADGVDCLLKADAKAIMTVGELLPRSDTFETDSWAPVVDGVALQTTIVARIAAGAIAPGVAILAGSNMDEGTIFMMLTPRIRCTSATSADLASWATQFYGPTIGAQVPQLYAKLRQPVPLCGRYAEEEAEQQQQKGAEEKGAAAARPVEDSDDEEAAPSTAAAAAAAASPPPPPSHHAYMAAMRSAGDSAITCRVRALANVAAGKGQPVYTYYFTHTPQRSANYKDVPTLGAFHGSEVPFVFGDGFELSNDAERSLAKAMGCYWRNFAHTGNPNDHAGDAACAGGARWPRFRAAGPQQPQQQQPGTSAGTREATMVLDVGKIGPEYDLKVAECAALLHA